MTEFCDFPYCACEGPRPTLKCGLPWRGPAEKAIAAKLAAASSGHPAAQASPSLQMATAGFVAQAPEYIHLVGYGRDHPDLDALRDLRAARRKRWLYKGAQAAFIGVLFAVGLFMAFAVGFMTVWYFDGQAIEQAQLRDVQ